ncbi:MAG TPA: thiamine phosphate synthase [Bacillota bacterium]|nr:thiamine phosphate synthase [Bacillota bacterium]
MRSRLSPGNDGDVEEGYSEPDLSLYVIADCAIARRPVPEIVEAALAGGATAVQLRWKTGTDRQILAVGEALRLITRRAGVPLIVNDRVDLALALEGDGVHLGPDDLPVRLARKLLGGGAIIGYSAGEAGEAAVAEAEGADYLGVGPFRVTTTKEDAGAPLGPAGLARVARAVRIPVIAIGGLGADTVAAAVAAGAAGVAVASAVMTAEAPEAACRELLQLVRAARTRERRP